MKPIIGPELKQARISKRISLRDFANSVKLDAGNYSRVERGVFAPPAREKLDEIMATLEIEEETQSRLRDLAELERGNLPTDLMDDDVLVKELPLLFRAVRECDQEALDEFIEAIRASGSA